MRSTPSTNSSAEGPTSSIRVRLLIGFGVGVAAVWLALSALYFRHERATLRALTEQAVRAQKQLIIENARALASDLRRYAEMDIAAYDFSGLDARLRELAAKRSDVVYAAVFDRRGEPVVSVGPPIPRAARGFPASPLHREIIVDKTPSLEFEEPLRFGDEPWGFFRLVLSIESVQREEERLTRSFDAASRLLIKKFAQWTVVILTIGGFAVFLFAGRIADPLEQLTQYARQLVRGRLALAANMPRGGTDEIGVLTRAFIDMADHIQQERARAESALDSARKAEAFLESIFEHIPLMIFVKDAHTLEFVRFNRAGEELLGIPREELIGRSDRDFFPPGQADYFQQRDRDTIAGGKVVRIEGERIRTRARGERVLNTLKIPILAADGTPRHLLGISEDVTDLRAAQEERRLFFDNALDLLAILDTEGRFLIANAALLEAVGLTSDEIRGRSLWEFALPDDVETAMGLLRAAGSGAPLVGVEMRCACPHLAAPRIIAWNASRDSEGSRIYLIGRDITEYRALESDVAEAVTREQERIAHDLHDGLGQLLTALAYKSKLIEDMLRRGPAPSPEQATALTQLANRAAQQARALARGLDPVVLTKGLGPALADLAYSTQELFNIGCEFTTDESDGALLKVVSIQLYRIAQEAVTNAARHARGTRILIALSADGDLLRLSVSDNGIGLPERVDEHERLGLRNMRYRANVIGATLEIRRRPEGGTEVICIYRMRKEIPHAANA